MNDLIEALNIFAKYMGDKFSPTHCEHDVLYVMCGDVSAEDAVELERLGFLRDEEFESWVSFRFGSA